MKIFADMKQLNKWYIFELKIVCVSLSMLLKTYQAKMQKRWKPLNFTILFIFFGVLQRVFDRMKDIYF